MMDWDIRIVGLETPGDPRQGVLFVWASLELFVSDVSGGPVAVARILDDGMAIPHPFSHNRPASRGLALGKGSRDAQPSHPAM